MLHIKYTEDFSQVESKKLRHWLKEENLFIPDKNSNSGLIPDEHGWLIILDCNSSIESLDTGIEVLNNLPEIDCWEYAIYNSEFEMWIAVVIVSDGLGMSFAIPDAILNPRLREALSNAAEI